MKKSKRPAQRRGLVLVAVLIVIAMLSQSAYEFAHWVGVEAEMTTLAARQTQARYLAESGVALVESMTILERLGREVPPPGNIAELFEAITVTAAEDQQLSASATEKEVVGRFSVFVAAPVPEESTTTAFGQPSLRWGTETESARLHLNHWAAVDPVRLEAVLLEFPGATKELVDSVLDWLDADDVKRPSGAEREEYEAIDPFLMPRNGPIESLDELLLVRGMTVDILMGEDTNGNGILDPNEKDGEQTLPFDDEDDRLNQGWRGLLTLWSRDVPRTRTGKPKVYLNDLDLGRLYGATQQRLGEPWARAVVAGRVLGGPGLLPSVTLPVVGNYAYPGILGLLNLQVNGVWEKDPVSVRSPLQSEEANFATELGRALGELTTDGFGERIGRVDLEAAPREVLGIVRPWSDDEIKRLLENRPAAGRVIEWSGSELGGSASPMESEVSDTAWLAAPTTVTLATLAPVEDRWTTDGAVLRFQSIGFFDDQRVSHRLEIVLDVGGDRAEVRDRRRWDRWGAGNSLEQWGQGAEPRTLPLLGEPATSSVLSSTLP